MASKNKESTLFGLENTLIIESIIKDMRKEGRAMVILTTHDTAQAGRIADRMLVLEQGELKG